MAENQLTQLRADVDVFTTFEGDNTVLLQLAAKGLLTDYQAMWGDLDVPGMVGKIAGQLGGRIVERTTGRAGIQRLIDAATGARARDLLDEAPALKRRGGFREADKAFDSRLGEVLADLNEAIWPAPAA